MEVLGTTQLLGVLVTVTPGQVVTVITTLVVRVTPLAMEVRVFVERNVVVTLPGMTVTEGDTGIVMAEGVTELEIGLAFIVGLVRLEAKPEGGASRTSVGATKVVVEELPQRIVDKMAPDETEEEEEEPGAAEPVEDPVLEEPVLIEAVLADAVLEESVLEGSEPVVAEAVLEVSVPVLAVPLVPTS